MIDGRHFATSLGAHDKAAALAYHARRHLDAYTAQGAYTLARADGRRLAIMPAARRCGPLLICMIDRLAPRARTPPALFHFARLHGGQLCSRRHIASITRCPGFVLQRQNLYDAPIPHAEMRFSRWRSELPPNAKGCLILSRPSHESKICSPHEDERAPLDGRCRIFHISR